MKTIQLTSIKIGEDRQRKDFDAEKLTELSKSIQTVGLLHPIILRSESDTTLVAGERRLRAIKRLYGLGASFTFDGAPVTHDEIPYTTLGELSEDQYAEVELVENVQREDLTWQEYAVAVDKLHTLRCRQNPEQKPQDTANEIRELEGKAPRPSAATDLVRDNTLLAQALTDPDIAKAKTKKEALKLLKKKKTQEMFNALAKSGSNAESTGAHGHTLLRGDARELLRQMPPNSIDCIITDPPYGINAQSFGDQADGVHDYDDTPEYFRDLMSVLSEESYRIAKHTAHLYLFHDARYFDELRKTFQEAGWYVWKTPIIWYKHGGMLPRPEHGPRRTYESILFASKNERRTVQVKNDCIVHVPKPARPRHAAEKPAELYVDLLERTCRPGDSILDPFAGCGPIFPAANHLQLTATGFNLSEDDYALALTRLSEQL